MNQDPKPENPPPPKVTLEGVHTLPPSFLGGHTWTRPESPQGILNIFKRLRDHEIWAEKAELVKELRGVRVDGEWGGLTLEPRFDLQWDLNLIPSLSWTDRYGVVGEALRLKEGSTLLSMIQIGGMEVDDLTFQVTPANQYERYFRHEATGRIHVVTLRKRFLTPAAMLKYGDPDKSRQCEAEDDGRVWYEVDLDHWNFFKERLRSSR